MHVSLPMRKRSGTSARCNEPSGGAKRQQSSNFCISLRQHGDVLSLAEQARDGVQDQTAHTVAAPALTVPRACSTRSRLAQPGLLAVLVTALPVCGVTGATMGGEATGATYRGQSGMRTEGHVTSGT